MKYFILVIIGFLLQSKGGSCRREIVALEGQRIVLECSLSGEAEWKLDGARLSASSRVYPSPEGLVISRAIHDQDDGLYTCHSQDMPSVASDPTSLSVTWIGDNVNVKLIGEKPHAAGQTLKLTCDVQGTSPISVQWFKNSDGLMSNGKIIVDGRLLTVSNVNPLDNGVYRCIASNSAGTVSSINTVVTTVPGDQWAQIVQWPEDVLVVPGSDAIFHCVYQFADVIEWYFEQTGPLENTTHYSVLRNGSLVVHNVTKKDEGSYSCVGIRGESTEVPQVFSAFLKTAYISGTGQLEPVGPLIRVVAVGGSLEVGCAPPLGLPRPVASWAGPGISRPSTVLSLSNLKKSATYVCSAANMAGRTATTLRVIVTRPPELLGDPEGMVVDEGQEASLVCRYRGDPDVTTISWIKDGIPLRGSGTPLVIPAVIPSDSGNYQCIVTTPPHPPVISGPAPIKVVEKLKFFPIPMDKVLELGTIKKIHCKAQGSPPPSVKWFKNGGELPSHVSDINGSLTFNPVKVEDKGAYSCIATNLQGVINSSISVDVVVSPKFIVLPKNPTDALEGYPVIMDCVAEGDPKPLIHWDKNSLMDDFDNTRFQILENGSLLIEEALLSDEGKYGCTAGNSGGLKRYEVSLVVRGVEGYRTSDGGEEDAVLSRTVAVTLGAAGAYMVLVIGLMAYCRCRSRRGKHSAQPDSLLGQIEGGGEVKVRCNGDTRHSDGEATAQSQCSNGSTGKQLPIAREHLSNMMLLGHGMFGEVCLAQSKGSTEGETVVMVKALEQSRDEPVVREFKRELDLFGRLDHPNIVRLLGLCQDSHPTYMILQYSDWGDLKQMLLATRKEQRNERAKPPELSVSLMLSLSHQLAAGMEAIANHRLTHRDLAARNCLISSKLHLKVSMSSLCKDTYVKEYYTHRNKPIAIRWQPYEVYSEDDYSTKSDVYSFAATVWEIFSAGEMPLAVLTDAEVASALEAGRLPWDTPPSCPHALSTVLQQCWSTSPTLRPTFSALALQLSELVNSHQQ